MVEQPDAVLRRHSALLIQLVQALERGVQHASDRFAREGWLRDENHGHLFSLFAKASAIEGPLHEAEELGILRMMRGPMESLRVVAANGDQLWVQRPFDGRVVHGTGIGVPRDAVSRPEIHFRSENAVQMAFNLLDEGDGGRLKRFVMLWDCDEDLSLVCRLVAPFAEGSEDSYWAWDFDLVGLWALESSLPPAADADSDLLIEEVDDGFVGDSEGDVDLGLGG